MEEPSGKVRRALDEVPRFRGLLLVGIAALGFQLGVIGPVKAAASGSSGFSLLWFFGLASPVCLFSGIAYLVLGKRTDRFFADHPLTIRVLVGCGVLLVIAVIGYLLSRGYELVPSRAVGDPRN